MPLKGEPGCYAIGTVNDACPARNQHEKRKALPRLGKYAEMWSVCCRGLNAGAGCRGRGRARLDPDLTEYLASRLPSRHNLDTPRRERELCSRPSSELLVAIAEIFRDCPHGVVVPRLSRVEIAEIARSRGGGF